MLEFLAQRGVLLTDAEEEAMDAKTRTTAKARRSTSPRMIRPEDIDDELLGDSGADEGLLAEALGMVSSTRAPLSGAGGDDGNDDDEERSATLTGKRTRTKSAKKPKAAKPPVVGATLGSALFQPQVLALKLKYPSTAKHALENILLDLCPLLCADLSTPSPCFSESRRLQRGIRGVVFRRRASRSSARGT